MAGCSRSRYNGFMHPILIAGAALVGLPILLHLIMKQEPKRLSFPAFRFLTQKLKTNQRKLRLRHFLLLALRMLLIALFCLALYQPTLLSERLNLRGEQPVATVIVIDTSPSMGYMANDQSRLDEARRRVFELLEELPEKSPVAIVTTDDPGAAFWQDVPEARKLVEKLDKPRGGGEPVSAALAQAYSLLSKVESRDTDEVDQLPKFVAVFTDRASASWDAARVEDLKKFRDSLPDPKPAHVVVDFGIDQPVNIGIISAEMSPQVIGAGQPANIVITVAATGPTDLPPADVTVSAKLTNGTNDRKQLVIPYGQSRAVAFEFKGLKPGVQQVEFSLVAADKLMADNARFFTFQVGEPRRLLAITDDPAAAVYWQSGLLAAKEPFTCLAVRPQDVRIKDGQTVVNLPEDPEKPGIMQESLRAFEAVCLLSVEDPNRRDNSPESLWDKLRPYVETGGRLIVIPGARVSIEGYAAAPDLMPGTFAGLIDTRTITPPPPPQTAPGWPKPFDGRNGVTWFLADDRSLQHPMLRPLRDLEWETNSRINNVAYPRRAWKYWDVRPATGANVVVRYNDAEKEAERRPAVLERTIADPKEPTRTSGRVLLLTTRMDTPADINDEWHDYWALEGSSWFSVFPWMVARHMIGDTADANFNFPTRATVPVPLRKGGVPRGTKVVIEGPGITGDEAVFEVGDRQTELRIGPPRTNQPGNFELSAEAVQWRDGFSLNAPAEESTLTKVPVEAIEELTGPGTVVAAEKNVTLRELLTVAGGQPLDLFPWLLIAVLLLLAFEGLVANRFYRKVK